MACGSSDQYRRRFRTDNGRQYIIFHRDDCGTGLLITAGIGGGKGHRTVAFIGTGEAVLIKTNSV